MQKEKNEKVENLTAYIDRLFKDSDVLFDTWKRWLKIEMITMATFAIAVILTNNPWIWLAGFNLWFLVLVYRSMKIDGPLNKKFGEINGCFETLYLLGMLDEPPRRGKKEKKNKGALLERLKETWRKINWQPKLQPQSQN